MREQNALAPLLRRGGGFPPRNKCIYCLYCKVVFPQEINAYIAFIAEWVFKRNKCTCCLYRVEFLHWEGALLPLAAKQDFYRSKVLLPFLQSKFYRRGKTRCPPPKKDLFLQEGRHAYSPYCGGFFYQGTIPFIAKRNFAGGEDVRICLDPP